MNRRNPFEVVLRLRRVQERQRAGDLAEARRRELAASDELAARRESHDALPPPEPELTARELRTLQLQGIRSLELLAEAGVALERERSRVVAARREWEQATRSLQSAERLSERRRLELAIAARRASDRALDELVVTRRARAAGRRR